MTEKERRRGLADAGLLHPHADAVTAPLFTAGTGFFLAADKVQVKYEMLRAHELDGLAVVNAAASHGYSRAGYYLVAAAFAERGMAGLLDERPGRRGPVKLTEEIGAYLRSATELSGAELAAQVQARFGVSLHRRTVERARWR
jgi:transposase